MPGAKCWPEAVWKAKGTLILATKPASCAWAAGAEEATARTAAIKPAGTLKIIELRMVVSPFGRRLTNRLHLLRRSLGGNSEMNLQNDSPACLRGAKLGAGMPPDIVHAYGYRSRLNRHDDRPNAICGGIVWRSAGIAPGAQICLPRPGVSGQEFREFRDGVSGESFGTKLPRIIKIGATKCHKGSKEKLACSLPDLGRFCPGLPFTNLYKERAIE